MTIKVWPIKSSNETKKSLSAIMWLAITHVKKMINSAFWKRLKIQIENQWPPVIRIVLQHSQVKPHPVNE